jgi:uncharacterized membrane protein
VKQFPNNLQFVETQAGSPEAVGQRRVVSDGSHLLLGESWFLWTFSVLAVWCSLNLLWVPHDPLKKQHFIVISAETMKLPNTAS